MVLPYYDYLSGYSSKKNDPTHIAIDQANSTPTNFTYLSAYSQGIHPPAPVYQSNQPAQPAMWACGAPPAAPAAAGWYNGYYYGAAAPATGWQLTRPCSYSYYPYSYSSRSTAPSTAPIPFSGYAAALSAHNYSTWKDVYSPYYRTAPAPTSWAWPGAAASPWYAAQTASAQAAAFLAANAATAASPAAPYYFVGATQADIMAQSAYIAQMYPGLYQMPQIPSQLVPFKPGASQQFWVKEVDGSWTLREQNDIAVGDLGPGRWERHLTSGYYYYVKTPI